MTGNAKVWRAPLAGLASVAMIATMGVTAFTASAATTTPKVTFVAANGTKTVQEGTEVKPEWLNPSKTEDSAVTATGWYTAAGIGNGTKVKPGTKVSSDVTYYEHYSADVWNVSFTGEGLDGVEEYKNDGNPFETEVAKGDKLAAWQVPTDHQGDSKLVDGWIATDETKTINPSEGDLADYARLNENNIVFKSKVEAAWTVTFDRTDFKGERWNQADADAPAAIDVKKGAKFSDYGTVPEFVNATGDRMVASWKATASDKTAFDPSAAVNASVVLHPASSSKFYTVTLHYADAAGADETVKSVKVVEGTTLAAPTAPTRSATSNFEFSFGGWYTSQSYADAAKYNFASQVTATYPKDLYAKWNISKVKVSFYPGYGENKPTEKWFANNDQFTVPEVPAREGFISNGYVNKTTGESASNGEGYLVRISGQTKFGFDAKDNDADTLLHYVTSDGDNNVNKTNRLYASYQVDWDAYEDHLAYVEGKVDVKSNNGWFTADSYKTYVNAYKTQYLPAKTKATENGINKAEYETLLKQLNALQSKLVEVADTTLFRVYNPNNGDHYFTDNYAEQSALVRIGWKAEGAPYKVVSKRERTVVINPGTPKADTDTVNANFGTPVWSAYNPNTGEHLLVFEAEANALVNAGWVKEAIKFYTVKGGTEKVLRVYNPNTNGPAHLYTKASEARGLAKLGWKIDNNAKPVFNLSK
ncbi:InlB B-repeat-containing protein [Bifidobacterium biavatii]|uniref:Glycoside hydrolase, family 25 n=1 Tax=Bifidobacterium biavatii DSM 23969 TaxID=1437608 RepID=A0A086ZN12_9BIFI|nr:InlB B-repeat-containing protein [Bifidobacterium biavatii]KFI47912.1 Glycoside hydrolase, family 25 [Bifidobacterium biavatii DSM 23969]